jgi:transcription elongation factor GreB
MARWRAAAPKSSPYITAAGYQALEAELRSSWERRAAVVQALAAAAAEGDRSENAEYLYRKKELAGIDRRIRYLQRRLPALTVVRQAPSGERVFFGAWVRLLRDDGTAVEYRIVGADETDAARGYISVDSPLARALLKKTPGDHIEMPLEERRDRYTVTGVRYEPPAA